MDSWTLAAWTCVLWCSFRLLSGTIDLARYGWLRKKRLSTVGFLPTDSAANYWLVGWIWSIFDLGSRRWERYRNQARFESDDRLFYNQLFHLILSLMSSVIPLWVFGYQQVELLLWLGAMTWSLLISLSWSIDHTYQHSMVAASEG